MDKQSRRKNCLDKSDHEIIEEFLTSLKKNRNSIIREWAIRARKISPTYNKITMSKLIESAAIGFEVFYSIAAGDDYNSIDNYIEVLTRNCKSQGLSLSELQQSFGNLRYILFPIIVERYDSGKLLEVLARINRDIDLIIFRISDCCQKNYDQELKDYAHKLEMEVQKRTRELEESRRNYQILFEEISDGCFVNKGGKIVFANKAFCEMHGYSLEELIGKECRQLIAEDSRSMVMEHFKKQIKGEIPYHQYIYCRQDKQGQRFPTENKVKLIEYNGEPAVLGLCSDITERIEMEEKIRQQDRLAIIGKLTTSIAHEIRNPLSAIKVNVELLLEKLKLEGNDLRRLQIANEQLSRLENIISQMLEFARPLKLDYALTSMHEIIEDAIKLLEQRIKENKVSLVRKLDPGLPNVMIDKERMLQAVDNVLTNALEALDRNNKHNKIEFEAKEEIYHSKEYVRLSIRDNGVGINPDDKKNIFEPFFTNGKRDGVGLGLPIVKKIVDTHHGHIQVESEKDKGTFFNLFIPVDIYS